MSKVIGLIMAGGVGNRLYPVSTPERPKQFLDLLDKGTTLIQDTVARLSPVVNEIHVVAPDRYKTLIEEQCPGVTYIREPYPKNTAPCILRAINEFQNLEDSTTYVIVPSDAFFSSNANFAYAIWSAVLATEENPDYIYCLGYKPTFPSTQFGYLEVDSERVRSFKEKPSEERAREYFAKGNYYWNLGIFVGKLGTFNKAFYDLTPELVVDKNWYVDSGYAQLPKISFDYAIMEKYPNVGCIPYEPTILDEKPVYWDDLGSFEAIRETKKWIKRQS